MSVLYISIFSVQTTQNFLIEPVCFATLNQNKYKYVIAFFYTTQISEKARFQVVNTFVSMYSNGDVAGGDVRWR